MACGYGIIQCCSTDDAKIEEKRKTKKEREDGKNDIKYIKYLEWVDFC